MREIKFKIWDKRLKENHIERLQDLCEDDYWYDGETEIWNVLEDCNNKQERFVALQYTELKDENDIEIFEGDIIVFSYDMFVGNFNTFVAKGIVVFEEGAFYVKCLENERLTKDESYLLYTINIDTIEVIGNIYDNPELLKGE